MEAVREWLKNDGYGYGYGRGYGDGDGTGSGRGYGDGYGSGSGSGDGDGSGSGSSDGYGSGSGYGYGDGYGDGSGRGSGSSDGDGSGSGYCYGRGYGDGYGSGSGRGSGSGIGSFNGQKVYLVDGIQTIITHIKDSVAKGAVLHDDLTLEPCFVVKGNSFFAHGKTLSDAREALREKIFESMNPEEAIAAFMKNFKKGKKYPGTDFFEWHHYLTGSCLMGRETFVRNRGINLEDLLTVEEFINICKDDFGSEVIRQLKECWEEA